MLRVAPCKGHRPVARRAVRRRGLDLLLKDLLDGVQELGLLREVLAERVDLLAKLLQLARAEVGSAVAVTLHGVRMSSEPRESCAVRATADVQ